MYRPFVGLTACVLSGVNTLKFGSYFPFLHFQYALQALAGSVFET
jgi:hypothetical protein